jgi:tetratricopeptide (TPR) repeat protein
VDWANKTQGWEQMTNLGLDVAFDARKNTTWEFEESSVTASRSHAIPHQYETETCARCHSRRGVQNESYKHGKPILDSHRVSRLSEGLYYPDGQILDEVYVYGSFLQSRMYHEGVTCSDCHEPHSLKLRADGDGVCYQCHKAEHFGSEQHHFHQPGSEGSSCVACHMPETNYMVVDPRRDHSMRIPRPDLSVKLGVPNACNRCHGDQDVQWAADKVAKWYGGAPENNQAHAEIIDEARKGNPNVIPDLERLIQDDSTPAIIRATLIDELAALGSPSSTGVIVAALKDDSPMVRQAAAQALAGADDNTRFQYLLPMLDDPVRGVRIEVVQGVLDLPTELITSAQRQALAIALKDYQTSLQINADRPEAQAEMANLSVAQGQLDKAEAHYRAAIKLDPTFAPAYVNWADLQYRQGNEQRGMAILQKGLQASPGNADLSHALGLSLIRQKQYEEAVAALRAAAEIAPDNVRYSYVYAIGLQSTGKLSEAISVLEATRAKHPYNREVLSALVSYYKEAGKQNKAIEAYEALQGIPR